MKMQTQQDFGHNQQVADFEVKLILTLLKSPAYKQDTDKVLALADNLKATFEEYSKLPSKIQEVVWIRIENSKWAIQSIIDTLLEEGGAIKSDDSYSVNGNYVEDVVYTDEFEELHLQLEKVELLLEKLEEVE